MATTNHDQCKKTSIPLKRNRRREPLGICQSYSTFRALRSKLVAAHAMPGRQRCANQLLVRIKRKRYDEGRFTAGRHKFPLLDCLHCRLSEDRVSSEKLSALYCPRRGDDHLHTHNAADIKPFQGLGIVGFDASDNLSVGSVVVVSLSPRWLCGQAEPHSEHAN